MGKPLANNIILKKSGAAGYGENYASVLKQILSYDFACLVYLCNLSSCEGIFHNEFKLFKRYVPQINWFSGVIHNFYQFSVRL